MNELRKRLEDALTRIMPATVGKRNACLDAIMPIILSDRKKLEALASRVTVENVARAIAESADPHGDYTTEATAIVRKLMGENK